jgi:hypothetical protein
LLNSLPLMNNICTDKARHQDPRIDKDALTCTRPISASAK